MAQTKPPAYPAARPSTGKVSRKAILEADDTAQSAAIPTWSADEDTERRPVVAPSGLAKRRTGRTGQGIAPPPAAIARAREMHAAAVQSPAPTGRQSPPSRISMQLGKLWKRKREAIGLSVAQVSSLTGIAPNELEGYEAGAKTPFDHALVIARVLGVPPTELPGIRVPGDSPLKGATTGAMQSLAEIVRVQYEVQGLEERLDGPLEALGSVPEFAIEVATDAVPEFPKGTLLGFVRERGAASWRGVVLAHHKRSRTLTLRRVHEHLLVGLHPDLPSYHLDRASWEALGRLVLVVQPLPG